MQILSRISRWFTDDTISPGKLPPGAEVDWALEAYLAGEEVDQCKVVIKYQHGYGYGDTPEQAKDDAASIRDAMQEIEDLKGQVMDLDLRLKGAENQCEFIQSRRDADAKEAIAKIRDAFTEKDEALSNVQALRRINGERFDEIRSLQGELNQARHRITEQEPTAG